MNSLGIITRAYDAEAPYIVSFIEYYLNLGVQEVHIVVPKGNKFGTLKGLCQPYNDVYVYTDYDVEKFNNPLVGVQNVALPKISSTHILSVDIDEYLLSSDIEHLLAHDYVLFDWIITPYGNEVSGKLAGFIDKQCKYLVKKSICNFLGEHESQVSNGVRPVRAQEKLNHYVYRSFSDLFLKCSMSKYGDYQSTLSEQFVQGVEDCTKLPLKFKMAAIYSRIVYGSNSVFHINHVKIDKTVEEELVQENEHYRYFDELKVALEKYKSRIDLDKLVKLVEKHPNYKLYNRLPHSVLAEISDKTMISELDTTKWFVPKKKFIRRLF